MGSIIILHDLEVLHDVAVRANARAEKSQNEHEKNRYYKVVNTCEERLLGMREQLERELSTERNVE